MIKKIILKNFKNIVSQTIDFSEKINIIVGENGQGKTSLFEAIHTLVYIKSFNELSDKNLLNFNENSDFYYIGAQIDGCEEMESVSIYYDKKEQKKIIKKNGEKVKRITEYFGNIDLVVFVQNDIDIIDDSEYRKRYFNRVISSLYPNYIEIYHKYSHLLKEKRALLRKDGYLTTQDKKLYKIYNNQLAKLSFELGQYKQNSYELMIKHLGKSVELYSKFKDIELRYKTPKTLEEWQEKFERAEEKELLTRRISEGIHRENFDIYYQKKLVNKFYSEGQKKMFSVLLKFGEFNLLKSVHQKTPILIFDDVYSKLDTKNIELIEEMLNSVDGQVFVSFIEEESCKHFKYDKKIIVKNGEFYDS